ncbi:MAG TPA: VOC family protein [Burkholderiales bacterium]|nr:VOC family protein [Burkholderiales bacterium]
MTHRSRICAILVDTSSRTHQAVAQFWSAALGRSLDYSAQERYATLPGPHLDCMVQRVEPGREGVHFDIETDDVDAEVGRLEKLGAKRVHQVKKWWVMEDPGGHRFCVVPVSSKHWPEGAVEWP